MSQKHKRNNCVQFLEGGLPCEDCDLKGHSVACGWHYDWHNCTCGAFDQKTEEKDGSQTEPRPR